MDTLIDQLKEKFLNMNGDIELIERKLKDEFCKIYEDDINPFLILNDIANIKEELKKITVELDDIYKKKNKSIQYMHRQMQNYNFLSDLENNLNIPSKESKIYETSQNQLYGYYKEQIDEILDNTDYEKISEMSTQANYNEYPDKIINDLYSNGKIENTEQKHVLQDFNENKSNLKNILNEKNKEDINNTNKCTETQNNYPYLFCPIDEDTFQAVPLLIRRRAKLEDINIIYKTLYEIALKKGSCLPIEKPELTQMNLQVFGQTGEAKLATLRYLKIIEIINRNGAVRLLNCPGLKKKKRKRT